MEPKGDWMRRGQEWLAEKLLGADLRSRLCAQIDFVAADRGDACLPTRFRVEIEHVLYEAKIADYTERTGRSVRDLERELAESAREHIRCLGVGSSADIEAICVRVEPHVMTRGVKIVAEFAPESIEATGAIPSYAVTFDGRSFVTMAFAPPDGVAATETRIWSEEPARVAWRVVRATDRTEGTSPAESWVLETGRPYEIGRALACDIVVPIETVSRRHARIDVGESGEATVGDLDSSNGTWVNDCRIDGQTNLRAGDRIRLSRRGAAHLVFRSI